MQTMDIFVIWTRDLEELADEAVDHIFSQHLRLAQLMKKLDEIIAMLTTEFWMLEPSF